MSQEIFKISFKFSEDPNEIRSLPYSEIEGDIIEGCISLKFKEGEYGYCPTDQNEEVQGFDLPSWWLAILLNSIVALRTHDQYAFRDPEKPAVVFEIRKNNSHIIFNAYRTHYYVNDESTNVIEDIGEVEDKIKKSHIIKNQKISHRFFILEVLRFHDRLREEYRNLDPRLLSCGSMPEMYSIANDINDEFQTDPPVQEFELPGDDNV